MPHSVSRDYPAEGEPLNALFVFAHGAGAGHDHPFMAGYAAALATRGVDVVTFNFPYVDAGRRMPDRAPMLEACVRAVVAESLVTPRLAGHALFIGGKSMGGRIASHLAAQGIEGLRGVIALGYPLHPPGKPEQLRVGHFPQIATPMLIVQGERDAFANPSEVELHASDVPGGVTIHAVAGGDHSLGVKGVKPEQMRGEIASVIVDRMRGIMLRGAGLTRPAPPAMHDARPQTGPGLL